MKDNYNKIENEPKDVFSVEKELNTHQVFDIENEPNDQNEKNIELISRSCRELIVWLNIEPFDKETWIEKFEEYTAKHRLLYSAVSIEVFSLGKDNTGNILTNLSSVMNISGIEENLFGKLIKLYDHINLANQQLNIIDVISTDSGLTIKDEITSGVEKTVNELNADFQATIHNQTNKIQNVEKNYIVILGIFASIIVTFVGSMAFSTSVLSNIHNNDIFEFVIVSIIIAQGFIHLVYLLISSIYKIYKETDYEYPSWMKTTNKISVFLIVISFLICVFTENNFEYIRALISNMDFRIVLLILFILVLIIFRSIFCVLSKQSKYTFIHKVNLVDVYFSNETSNNISNEYTVVLDRIIEKCKCKHKRKHGCFIFKFNDILRVIEKNWFIIKINKKTNEYIKYNIFDQEEIINFREEYMRCKYKWKTLKSKLYSCVFEETKF